MTRAGRSRQMAASLCVSVVLLSLCGCAGPGGSVVAEFELDACSDAIYVPVICRGEEHLFLLDTGASVCVFDTSMRDQLGYPIGRHYAMTHSGEEAVDLYNSPPLTVGGRQLNRDDPVICQDLLSLHVALDRRVTGVLGMSFLEDYALELDPDHSVLRILESPVETMGTGWHTLRLDLEPYGGPKLAVDVGDTADWHVTVDTGCSFFGAMDYTLCERLLSTGVATPWGSSTAMTPHRAVDSDLVLLESLAFGSLSHVGPVLTRGESSVLGLPFLYSYNVILDFPERAAYLRPRRPDAPPGYDNPIGVAVHYGDSNLVVSAVAEGGLAERAGLQKGDVIVGIAGSLAPGAPLTCVHEYFRVAPDDPLRLDVVRGSESVRIFVVADADTAVTRVSGGDAEQQPAN